MVTLRKIIISWLHLLLLLLCLTLTLTSCGPRARISPDFSAENSRSVAFLPVVYGSGVRKERVDIIKSLISTELSSAGYVVLDDEIITRMCPNSECCLSSEGVCIERENIEKEYGVKNFVHLDVDSIARNNFLAGYFNSITGSLVFSDSHRKDLINIDHSENERGGLLFNSGQIFQGVISQYKNFGEDESFEKLAGKFAKSLVSKVPGVKSSTNSAPASAEVTIVSVDVRAIEPAIYSICAVGSPGAVASLVINKEHSNLREVSVGRYCGVFHLADISRPKGMPEIELRSPYGALTRREFREVNLLPCDLSSKVALETGQSQPKIVITSSSGAAERFQIYRGVGEVGPFQKVAETKNLSWVDTSVPQKEKSLSTYQVVCVDPRGVRSTPEAAQTKHSA